MKLLNLTKCVICMFVALPIAQAATITVERVANVPAASEDSVWESIEPTKVVLSSQIIAPPVGGGAVSQIHVQAVHDDEWFALRLEWSDPTINQAVGVDRFRDAVAVGFPITSEPTSPFMGDADHPVAIWQWSANHQANTDGKGKFAVDYPKTDGVWYADHDAAMSLRVHRWRGVEPAEHFVAQGFGTLRPEPDNSLTGTGGWADGTWTVVLRRQLTSSAAPSFQPGASTQMIIAVWDGGNNEVNGRKSITMNWLPVNLEK